MIAYCGRGLRLPLVRRNSTQASSLMRGCRKTFTLCYLVDCILTQKPTLKLLSGDVRVSTSTESAIDLREFYSATDEAEFNLLWMCFLSQRNIVRVRWAVQMAPLYEFIEMGFLECQIQLGCHRAMQHRNGNMIPLVSHFHRSSSIVSQPPLGKRKTEKRLQRHV